MFFFPSPSSSSVDAGIVPQACQGIPYNLNSGPWYPHPMAQANYQPMWPMPQQMPYQGMWGMPQQMPYQGMWGMSQQMAYQAMWGMAQQYPYQAMWGMNPHWPHQPQYQPMWGMAQQWGYPNVMWPHMGHHQCYPSQQQAYEYQTPRQQPNASFNGDHEALGRLVT